MPAAANLDVKPESEPEEDLLENTLRGAVRALAEVLAIVDPVAYCQALRVQKLAGELAEALSLGRSWEIEAAALLSHLGGVSLPADLQQRIHESDALAAADQRILACVPQLTDRLLAHVPRLEEVRSVILLRHRQSLPDSWPDQFGETLLAQLKRGAAILRVAEEFDTLLLRGHSLSAALGLLRAHAAASERELVECLAGLKASDVQHVEVRSLPLSRLRVGMVFAEAVYSNSGQLLVLRGFEINQAFLERVANFRRGHVREPLQVILPSDPAPQA